MIRRDMAITLASIISAAAIGQQVDDLGSKVNASAARVEKAKSADKPLYSRPFVDSIINGYAKMSMALDTSGISRYEKDGHLDLYVSNRIKDSGLQSRIYLGDLDDSYNRLLVSLVRHDVLDSFRTNAPPSLDKTAIEAESEMVGHDVYGRFSSFSSSVKIDISLWNVAEQSSKRDRAFAAYLVISEKVREVLGQNFPVKTFSRVKEAYDNPISK
ncbi:hypothetical protein J4401_06810 [Candidatus Woesearchaeota archaeon]|nr:hypothetical protein [Candidatus Woesearchaeota archaeon]